MPRFPYDRARPGQLEIAKALLKELEGGAVAVLDAPTGFGKTAVALYTSLTLVEKGVFSRVIYVVRTRNEIDPVMRELKSMDTNFTVLYSARRMCPLASLRGVDVDPYTFWSTCSSLRLRGLCPYYARLERIDRDSVEAVLRSSTDHVSTAQRVADRLGVCPFFAFLNLVDSASVVIATYPYIFKKRVSSILMETVDTSSSLLIVDEAHSLIDFGNLVGESIPLDTIPKALNELEKFFPQDPRAREVTQILKTVIGIVPRNADRGLRYVDIESMRDTIRQIVEVAKELSIEMRLAIATRISKSVEDSMTVETRFPQVASFLETLARDGFELYVSRARGGIELHALPSSPEPVKEILNAFKAVLLMSGTAPPKSVVERIAGSQRGVSYIDSEDYGAPNYVRSNTCVVLLRGLSSSYRLRDEHVYRQYAQLVDRVFAESPPGIVMAVYPSYEFMHSVHRYLRSEPKVVEDSGMPVAKLYEALHREEKLLVNAVASGKLSEGIEVLHGGRSAIHTVIVAGVPYPQPNDYVNRVAKSFSSDENEFYRAVAAIRTLQAVGRAVRSEHDYALIILADSRFGSSELLKMLRLRIRFVARSLEKVVEIARAFYAELHRVRGL